MKKKGKLLTIIVAFLVVVLIGFLDYWGVFWHNAFFAWRYATRGLDVSHYQGDIDWPKVAAAGKYSFVYIKATEGHDYIDDKFIQNWEQAKQQQIWVGAYHFFSMRSSGQEQAAYFIALVPQEENALPPAIDVEIHLDHDPEKVRKELQEMMTVLEKHYQKKPIIYATYQTYERYIRDYFPEHKVWIRDILFSPRLSDRDWTIWQYNNRGRVNGIEGYVDINVLQGQI